MKSNILKFLIYGSVILILILLAANCKSLNKIEDKKLPNNKNVNFTKNYNNSASNKTTKFNSTIHNIKYNLTTSNITNFNNNNNVTNNLTNVTFHNASQYKQNIKFWTLITHKIPVICILVTYYYDSNIKLQKARIHSSYVNWIESGGAMVMPLFANKKYEIETLSNCSGLLIQNEINKSKTNLSDIYESQVKTIYQNIKKLNDNGFFIPILAIGTGAHILQAIEADTIEILFNYSSINPIMRQIELVESDVRRIRMLHYFDGRDVKNLIKMNITAYYNKYSVSPDSYLKLKKLKNTFKVIALARVNNYANKKFVAMFEAYRYPIYGIEFDPARYIYNRLDDNSDSILPYTNEAITISQKILNFFVKESFTSLYKKVDKGIYSQKSNKLRSKLFDGVNTNTNNKTYVTGEGYYYSYVLDLSRNVIDNIKLN